jgi:hypothetical protein
MRRHQGSARLLENEPPGARASHSKSVDELGGREYRDGSQLCGGARGPGMRGTVIDQSHQRVPAGADTPDPRRRSRWRPRAARNGSGSGSRAWRSLERTRSRPAAPVGPLPPGRAASRRERTAPRHRRRSARRRDRERPGCAPRWKARWRRRSRPPLSAARPRPGGLRRNEMTAPGAVKIRRQGECRSSVVGPFLLLPGPGPAPSTQTRSADEAGSDPSRRPRGYYWFENTQAMKVVRRRRRMASKHRR